MVFSSPSTSGAEDSVMGAWLGEGELGVVSLSPVGQWRGVPSPGDWGSGSDVKPTTNLSCGALQHLFVVVLLILGGGQALMSHQP